VSSIPRPGAHRPAAGVIADTVIDLVGTIGRHVLANLMPNRRIRSTPRVVKRAISKYVAKGTKIRGPSYKATISIDILAPPTPLPTAQSANSTALALAGASAGQRGGDLR
jgi:hypothetical protein